MITHEDLAEGLRLANERRAAEWAALSWRRKVGALWDDLPWVGRIVVFVCCPILFVDMVAALTLLVLR